MKRYICIISAISLGLFFLCSSYGTLSEADKQWLLLPQDLPDTLFSGYLPQKNSGGKLFFFKKTKTSLSGFSAVFEQKLTHARKGTVLYTVQVSYARNETDARALVAALAHYHQIRQMDRRLLGKDASLDILLRIWPGVFLDEIDPFHYGPVFVRENPQNLAGLAPVLPRQHMNLIVFLDMHFVHRL